MKTRLRWFWVALGAFLAIIGEEFLRKLLALSLCGVFLLSYCLPDAKYSASVVAQTPQPAIIAVCSRMRYSVTSYKPC
ncbi:MAG: hypothetical protein IM477_15050 [Microcystis sp. M090S1]|uniref:hypothetical protein n=1 Tax=Microcystis sp. M090S1 TaxID=2771135 RepID=UPI00258CBDEF|nr:hypothetical protein [Microcystis sp. M090S1]MCA2813780.1 hypothetical protein [Microcystis sp. M090S1]